MNDKYKLLKENPQNCQRLFGMKYDIFEDILKKVQNNIQQKLTENPLSKRGIDSKFSIENQLLLTLEYLRQYPTFISLAFSYGISESYANKVYHKIRDILSHEIGLKNPEKLKFNDVKRFIINVTIQPIEHPQNNQHLQYNGSKKTHY